MHSPSLKSAVRRIRSLAGAPDGLSDTELLSRYRSTRDDRAFAALVARHGPAVLGTCRRVLADSHAAEDAFQATFLVLARRAGAVRRPAALGCWLHGVAVRVSTKLKGRLARQPRSVENVEVPSEPRDDVLWRDVRRVLDEEVNRLPERLRLPVYLCYFEGKTRDEAADALGWKVSTLRGRLEDGRSRLRVRLALRGIELSAALLAAAATDGLAVSDGLVESTVRAAGGAASELARSLARGVAATGVAAKAKLTAGAMLLAVGLGTAIFGFRGEPGRAAGPGPGPKSPPPAAKPQPPAELIALMERADRVWVVDSPTDKDPISEPVEVLKGQSPPDKAYSFRYKAEALKDLPRETHRWVVFLKSIDEVDHIPKIVPVAADKWYAPADDATVAALREYVPPCQWGEASNGLRLGLYARPKADEPTVEVVLQNVGANDLTVAQLRGNYFDDWPELMFAVTGPFGRSYRLERRDGAHKDGDAPTIRVLKAGHRYIHVIRLNHWLTAPDGGARGGTAGNAPAGLFAGGGDFKVQATYQLTDGHDPTRWWIGKLTAGPVTVSVPKPGAYGDATGDFRIRLRPTGKLKPGDSPELVIDAKYAGKAKWTIERRPENAEVEWDGKWYSPPVRRSSGGVALTELAPGSEFLPWETVRPDGAWAHERDKPGAAGDPGEATKELVPFRLTPGTHTVRVAYWFGKDVRAVSNAITVEVAPDGWGPPAGGIKARLRLPKTKLKPGDSIEFALDLKNVGRKTWSRDADPFACFVYVDNVPYTYTGPIDRKTNSKELKPGGELVPFLNGTVDANWQGTPTAVEGAAGRLEIPVSQSVPFRLSPGKHEVRLAFPLDGRNLLAVSNAVEIEVEPAKLDAVTEIVARLADRIWMVPSPTRGKPVPSPSGVLKGPPADAGRGGLFDLRLLPGDDPNAKWIVFLVSEDDGERVPKVKVWPYGPWSRPYTPELADAIRQAFLPTEWGPDKDDVRLDLRLRETNPRIGEPVVAEVTIRNTGTKPRELQQLRYNIYDYWPQLGFEVSTPDGSKWVLQKPEGEIKEADAPTHITLKPGETYTHAVRLDRWPAGGPKDRKRPDNVFTMPGEYTIACRYAPTHPLNEANWAASLVSTAAKLTLRDPATEPAWGDAVNGLRARVRLAKSKLGPEEPLSFALDLKNERFDGRRVEADEHRCWFVIDGYKLPLDGLRYFYAGPPGLSTVSKDLRPHGEERGFLTVTPDERWMRKNPGLFEFPYRRPVGKHILVVEYQADEKTRVRTPAVEFEAADDYGDPVDGAAVRLRMKKTVKAGETPPFDLDLKNTADKTYVVPVNVELCELHLDGVRYTREDRLKATASNSSFYPGAEFVPFLKGDLGGKWTVPTRTGDPGPLPLGPGKHRIKILYPVAKDVKPVTREVEFEVVGDEWGPPVGGVSARLRLAKAAFKADEPFAFELDLKNTGDQTYATGPLPQSCRIELDGLLTYTYIGPIDLGAPVRRLLPGGTFSPFVRVTTDRNWAHADWLYVPFKLTPGKHTARVSYPLSGKVTPTSQPVTFTVTADEWGEPSGGIRARVRLAKPTFKAGEPLAFELDLKNTGEATIEDGPIPMFCLINLDGAEYRYTAPLGYPTSIQKLTPGKEFVPWVKVETNQWWTHLRGDQAVPLALTPGKHTLKVSYPLPGDRKPTSPAIEFEVTDQAAKPPDLAALAAATDRIVVAHLTRRSGIIHVESKRAIKGPNQRWAADAHPIVVPAGCDVMPGEVPDDPIPGSVQDVGAWILFLKAEEDDEGPAKLTPAVPHGWYRRATDKEIEAVVAALPRPTEAGAPVNGLAQALRPKTRTVRAGEDVRLEVVLTNTTKDALRVLQQRYNVYDYWPFLTFQVTLPNGQKLTVAKPEGPFTKEDFIDEVSLKPGASYAHAVRLNHWPAVPRKQTEDLGLPPYAFAVPGTYKVQVTYKAPVGFQNLRPGVEIRDWPFWNGEVTSNTVTVEVKSPFDEVRQVSEKGQIPLLYVVLTRPKPDVAALASLVAEHAADALAEAGRRKFADGNVVFLVRDRAGDEQGYATGFSRAQLEEIRRAKPDAARRLVERHAWSVGKLPAGK
jgi:RNA polymerase sigma factor (sigma-70 family)